MDTKASRKASYNANSAAETTREGMGGLIFTNSPRREGKGEVVRGKLQTNTVRFVCFFPPTPWKTRVCLPFWPDNNICKQLLAYKKKVKEKKHNAITPLPIKTELNKSLSSNHSHMNTCVVIIPQPKTFLSYLHRYHLKSLLHVFDRVNAFISGGLCSMSKLIIRICTAHVCLHMHICKFLLR